MKEEENVGLLRTMIAEGHLEEAAEWCSTVAYALPEPEVRALLHILASAVIDPGRPKRKRGDRFTARMTFQKLAKEVNAAAVAKARVDTGAAVTVVLDEMGQDPKAATSVGTLKRRYYKHSR